MRVLNSRRASLGKILASTAGIGGPFFGVWADAFARTALLKGGVPAVIATSILAAGKTLGQVVAGVKRGKLDARSKFGGCGRIAGRAFSAQDKHAVPGQRREAVGDVSWLRPFKGWRNPIRDWKAWRESGCGEKNYAGEKPGERFRFERDWEYARGAAQEDGDGGDGG